jgi:hypothetical protein
MTDGHRYHLVDEDGREYVVRDSKLNDREDLFIYADRSVRTTYAKHGLRRVVVQWVDRSTVRHYWRRMRVPWIVWAMFS